jgi:hypothetical protein
MIDLDRHEWDDVEDLVRQAGGYVRPSEEMRPRVIEAARAESRERQAQRRIWQAALALAAWGAISIATAGRFSTNSSFSAGMLHAQAELRQADAHSAEIGAAGWGMVDSFTNLRRRQAELLRMTR